MYNFKTDDRILPFALFVYQPFDFDDRYAKN